MGWRLRPQSIFRPPGAPAGVPPVFAAVTVLLLVSLWLVTRPYFGIIHDTRLYLFLALSHLYPDAYANDLFLQYGSQDSYSLVGPLLAPALARFSSETVNLVMTVLGQIIWLVAATTLVRVFYHSWPQRALALGALIALPPDYSSIGVFSYGEAFFTPRPFAEAMILLAIAAFFRGRWTGCFAACVAALMLHPLMAAPGLVVIFCLFALKEPRLWLVPVVGAGALSLLAHAGIEPFTRLFATMSGDWLAISMDRNPWAFFSRWTLWDFLRIGLQGAIVAVALRGMSAQERRMTLAIGLVVSAGAIATFVGADVYHDLFIINLQPARAFWLAGMFVNMSAGAGLYSLFHQRSLARWHYATALAIYALSGKLLYVMAFASAPLTVSISLILLEAKNVEYKNAYRLSAFALSAFALASALGLWIMAAPIIARIPGSRWVFQELATICIIFAAAVVLHFRRLFPASALAIAAFGLTLSAVDRRDAWEKLTGGAGDVEPANRLLGHARNVYWEGGVELMWLRLHRASYYSCLQGSGVMFYSRTALEYRHRNQVLSTLGTLDFDNRPGSVCPGNMTTSHAGLTEEARIKSVCRALPDLDMMALLTKVDALRPASWNAPAAHSRPLPDGTFDLPSSYYFYDCRTLRQSE